MRVLICGDRHWDDYCAIEYEVFTRLEPGDVIIQGGAKGADRIAWLVGDRYGLEVLLFAAEWALYGRAAGPIRNQRMLDEGEPDEVWAFHPDLPQSKGTKDMVKRALKAGLPVYLTGQRYYG